jgi:hypothetical protein
MAQIKIQILNEVVEEIARAVISSIRPKRIWFTTICD